jgi:hypothetical protein
MSQDLVGVQGAGIGVAGAILDVGVAVARNGGSSNPWLARHNLGDFAVLALDGDVCGFVLHTPSNLRNPRIKSPATKSDVFHRRCVWVAKCCTHP